MQIALLHSALEHFTVLGNSRFARFGSLFSLTFVNSIGIFPRRKEIAKKKKKHIFTDLFFFLHVFRTLATGENPSLPVDRSETSTEIRQRRRFFARFVSRFYLMFVNSLGIFEHTTTNAKKIFIFHHFSRTCFFTFF